MNLGLLTILGVGNYPFFVIDHCPDGINAASENAEQIPDDELAEQLGARPSEPKRHTIEACVASLPFMKSDGSPREVKPTRDDTKDVVEDHHAQKMGHRTAKTEF